MRPTHRLPTHPGEMRSQPGYLHRLRILEAGSAAAQPARRPDRRGGKSLRATVLDPSLADGARARPHCRATSLPEAVAEIARRAGNEDRAIVGWSLFDRTVIQKTDLPKTVKDVFVARYINGRALASRWKSVVHPDLKLPKDDAFDTRNRLDRFAELTQYPGVTGLRGEPAAWLRRVTQRMAANDGKYRLLKPTVKSLWHRLLLYNEHDCRALAHIARRVTFELGKWREHEQTRFCVFDAPRAPLCFTVGSRSSRLAGLLDGHGVDRWVLITAWNRAAVELPREENDRRQEELHSRLSNYIVIPGEGAGRDATRPPEPSLMILGIRRKEAIRLGRSFGQIAVVAGHKVFQPACCPALRCQSCPGPALYQSLGRGKRFGDASGRASHRWRARLQLALVNRLRRNALVTRRSDRRRQASILHGREYEQTCRCLQGRCSFPSTSNETPRGSPPDSRGPSPRPCRERPT